MPGPLAGLEDRDCRFDEAFFGDLTGQDSWLQLEDLREQYGDRGPGRSSDDEASLPATSEDGDEPVPMDPSGCTKKAPPPRQPTNDDADLWVFDATVAQQEGSGDVADDAWDA